MISLSQFVEKTEAECLALVLEYATDAGFNTTSWQSGSFGYSICRVIALVWSNLTSLLAALALLAFNDTSEGDALTAYSKSVYQNTRYLATRATLQLTLTDTGSTGPHNIVAAAYVYRDENYGYLYRNLTGGLVPLGGSLTIQIQAETAGTAYNVGNNTITEQVTPIAGLTVTNDVVAGTATSIITAGTDAESDVALRLRNTDKWPTLSSALPRDAYSYLARTAAPGAITRTAVDDTNPDGPGTLTIYCAGPSGTAAGSDVTAAQTLITLVQPEHTVATAEAAPVQTQAFTANVYVDAAYFTSGVIQTAKKTEIEAAVSAYVNGLDIGGTVLPAPDGDGTTGYILKTEWQGAVTSLAGVRAVGSPSPDVNAAVDPFHVATVGSITFTYVAFG